MTSERLQEMLRAKPFRPFGLRLADGEVIPVVHPEFWGDRLRVQRLLSGAGTTA